MARVDVKGAKQFNYELPAQLVDEFREFCRLRGEAVRDHLEIALRRHLATPPPPLKPVIPPLPEWTGDPASGSPQTPPVQATTANANTPPKGQKRKKRTG